MSNKTIKYVRNLVMLTVLLLSGCGGDGSSTQSVGAVSVTLTADKTEAIASTTDSVTLTATVKDASGAPLAGTPINFNVPPGTYPYASIEHTNLDGTAVIHLQYPPIGPNSTQSVAVTATSGSITSNEVVVSFSNPQNAASVSLEADKSSIIADGIASVKLTATTKDASGVPLAGQAVVFNVPAGFIVTHPVFTDTSGQTFVVIKPGPNELNKNQTISVTASSNGVTASPVSVALTAQ